MSRPVVNACACNTRFRRSDSPPWWMRTEPKSCPNPDSIRLRTSPDSGRPPARARSIATSVCWSTSAPPSGSSPPPLDRRMVGGWSPSAPSSLPSSPDDRRKRCSTSSAIASASCSAGSAAWPTTSFVWTYAAVAALPAVACNCSRAFDIGPEPLFPALAGVFSASSLRCSCSCCAPSAIVARRYRTSCARTRFLNDPCGHGPIRWS